jgi:hypothetical protein
LEQEVSRPADKRMFKMLCKKTQICMTHQQCMGQQSRISAWPDSNMLILIFSVADKKTVDFKLNVFGFIVLAILNKTKTQK